MSMQGEQLLQAIVNPPGNIIIKNGVMLLVPEAALVLAVVNNHVFHIYRGKDGKKRIASCMVQSCVLHSL